MRATKDLQSASQAWSIPLVGVWLAGVAGPRDAHVWAACARFLLSRAARDKALPPDMSFLVLIYSMGDQAACSALLLVSMQPSQGSTLQH